MHLITASFKVASQLLHSRVAVQLFLNYRLLTVENFMCPFIYITEHEHLPMSTECVGHIVPVCVSREKTAYLAEFCDSKAVNSVVPKPWSRSDKTS